MNWVFLSPSCGYAGSVSVEPRQGTDSRYSLPLHAAGRVFGRRRRIGAVRTPHPPLTTSHLLALLHAARLRERNKVFGSREDRLCLGTVVTGADRIGMSCGRVVGPQQHIPRTPAVGRNTLRLCCGGVSADSVGNTLLFHFSFESFTLLTFHSLVSPLSEPFAAFWQQDSQRCFKKF